MTYNKQGYAPFKNNNFHGNNNFNPQGIRYDSQKAHRPKSGCQFFHGTDNKRCITAWKIDKREGFISFKAYPISKDGLKKINSQRRVFKKDPLEFEARTKNGTVRERWFAKVKIGFTYKRVNAFYDTNSGKLYLPLLNMVASHKGSYSTPGKKGFFGRISKR